MNQRHDSLLERLRASPRVSLGTWPTRLERIARPGKCDLLIKRDDLSGFGRGGAKARKIGHLLGHLRAHGHRELLAVAGNISNLAFDLVLASVTFGFPTRLFIVDDPPATPAERERLFAPVAGRVELLGAWRLGAAATVLRAYFSAQRRHQRPFLALPGASHPACVIGNACGFLEMVEQLEALGAPLPKTVFVTAATGTTMAGFLLAAHALAVAGKPTIEVVGVQAYPGPVKLRTLGLTRWTERFLSSRGQTPVKAAQFRPARLGFGEFGSELTRLCARVEASVGIQIDPIFGGKTWQAMEADAAANAPGERPVLYWHCGFTPEWQALRQISRARGSGAQSPDAQGVTA